VQTQHDDAYTPSLAFTIATCLAGLSCLAQDLPPFVRLLAVGTRILTIDDQSHARGRCCHSCTGRIGVDVSHDSCYHLTDVDTQLSKFVVVWRPLLAKLTGDLCLLSPVSIIVDSVSGERVAPSHWSRPLEQL